MIVQKFFPARRAPEAAENVQKFIGNHTPQTLETNKESQQMRNWKKFAACAAGIIAFACSGCWQVQGPCEPYDANGKQAGIEGRKFRRLYGYSTPKTEEQAKIYASLGVKGLSTSSTPENIALLHKYGIEAYARFGPDGYHASVLTSEEQKIFDFYRGKDLPKELKGKERAKVIAKRLQDVKYSFGGEPMTDRKEVLWDGPYPCFIGEKAREKACRDLDKVCARPGIDGVAFDFVGYQNYYGCQHPDCLKLCAEYLKKHNLEDTKENRAKFYLHELTEYYRVCAEHIKKINPKFKVMAHLYPVFEPMPLYGNRLQIDIAGESCAWYRRWDLKKVEEHAKYVRENQHKYFKTTECVPFLAYTVKDFADVLTPDDIEKEMQAILRSGTDVLMVHELTSVAENPEVLKIFRKYCSPE